MSKKPTVLSHTPDDIDEAELGGVVGGATVNNANALLQSQVAEQAFLHDNPIPTSTEHSTSSTQVGAGASAALGGGVTAGAEAGALATAGTHVGDTSVSASAGALAGAHAGLDFGGHGSVGAQVMADANATASAGITGVTATGHIGVSAGVSATQGEHGALGGGVSGGQDTTVSATVGAEAGGGGHIGLTSASGGFDTSAGASLSASEHGVVEGHGVKAEGTGTIYSPGSVGVAQHVSGGIDDGKLHLDVALTGKLGIVGVGFQGGVSIDAKPAIDGAQRAGVAASDAVVSEVKSVFHDTGTWGTATAQGATNAAHATEQGVTGAAHATEQGVKAIGNDTAHAASTAAHQVAHGVSSAAHHVTHAVHHVTHGISHAAATIGHGVIGTANTVAHGATQAAHAVSHGATQAAHSVAHGVTSAANEVGHVASSAASTVGGAATTAASTAAHAVADTASTAVHTVADTASSAAHTVENTASTAVSTISSGVSSAASSVANALNPGRVICTHFYRKGLLDRETWRADLEFTFQRLSPTTVRGYQAWAIPYVRLMRRSPLAERIMLPLARWRAEELAYQMGRREKGSIAGKLVRMTLEPVCFAIGLFAGEQDWRSLWRGTELDVARETA